MPNVPRAKLTVDEIAKMASQGENVAAHFTNKFTLVQPVRRVSADLTPRMLRQLGEREVRSAVQPDRVLVIRPEKNQS